MIKTNVLDLVEFDLSGVEFYATEKQAIERCMSKGTRKGFNGKMFACVLEIDDRHFYSLVIQPEKPQNLDISHDYYDHWYEVKDVSSVMYFHEDRAVAAFLEEINKKANL